MGRTSPKQKRAAACPAGTCSQGLGPEARRTAGHTPGSATWGLHAVWPGARTWRCELAALAIQGPVPGLVLRTSGVMETAPAPLSGMPALNPGLAPTSSLSTHPPPRRTDAGLGNCSPVPTVVERQGILFPEARLGEMIWTAVAPGSLHPEARM